MKPKATHKGTCQSCFKIHKLPNGVLSNHGYNVEHHFFNGICMGAKALPLEQDCEIVKQSLEYAEKKLAELVEFSEKLLEPAIEPIAYVKKYIHFGSIWVKVIVSSSDGYNNFRYQFEDGKEEINRIHYGFPENITVHEVANELNKIYSEILKQGDILQIEHYIKELKSVLKHWKPRDLLPLDYPHDRHLICVDK